MIDTHVHISGDDTLAYPWAPHDHVPLPDPPFTAEQLIREMDAQGVSQALAIQPRVYGYDHGYLFDAAERHADRLRILPLINVVRSASVRELEAHIEMNAVAGVRVIALGEPPATWLTDGRSTPAWTWLSERRLAVGLLVDPPQLPLIAELAHRFPELPIVLDHMGRCRASTPREHLEALLALSAADNVTVKLSALSTRSEQGPPHADLHPLLQGVCEAFGSRRVMWGTDAPHTLAGGYASSAEHVMAALPQLTTAEREWILDGNARYLFGFEAPS